MEQEIPGTEVPAEDAATPEVEGDAEIDVEAAAAPEADATPEVQVEVEVTPEPEAPRRRGPRRAASRPAGPPTAAVFSAAEPSEAAAEIVVRPSTAMVAAVFQAPDHAVMVKAATEAEPAPGQGGDTAQIGDVDESADAAAAADGAGEDEPGPARRRRRRGGRGRGRKAEPNATTEAEDDAAESGPAEKPDQTADSEGITDDSEGDEAANDGDEAGGSRRRRRRRRKGSDGDGGSGSGGGNAKADSGQAGKSSDEVTGVKGSTRLEAKKQRRREGRVNRGSRAPILTEAEFLARRESVDRKMIVRQRGGLTQIGVLEDEVLVEHYVASEASTSIIGNVYLGRVQNVLPSMEAAFVDIGRGRNAVLYAGEVNWDAAGLEGQPKRIELALKSGDTVLVQATKDPVGHKGSRLTSQISLPGRFLVYVPEGGMTGISRKLPDRERARLKKILKTVVPEDAGVIVRTAAEGASEENLRQDVERLAAEWERISQKATSGSAPTLLRSEPDLTLKVARDIFNEDFTSMIVSGDRAFGAVSEYIGAVAPDLADRVSKWTGNDDVFAAHRIDEQLAKALDRKVWLPSGGSLVIDRTEAMTVIDVNTGKFVGKGGNLEETVTRNNLEAAEEIVRQLRLRDIGGIIVVDFIDMVLESNRELVLRRLVECLSRDRTKHQVAEVTSLGLVQMTRKRIGQGLLETFSVPCESCNGRGVKVQTEPIGQTGEQRPAQRARRPKITGPIPGAPTAHKPAADEVEVVAAEATEGAPEEAAEQVAPEQAVDVVAVVEVADGGHDEHESAPTVESDEGHVD
ncbi:MAG: ribonuclease [Actinomycetota bacterium]|nr:ribonuclease [Actinomycetota bacterium]